MTSRRLRPLKLYADAVAAIPPAPATRAECINGPRPCPHLRCKYHLGSEPRADGTLDIRSLSPSAETCALDLIQPGGIGQGEIADALGITQQAVDRIEFRALRKLANMKAARELLELKSDV